MSDLDERLRSAFHDLDQRVAAHLAAPAPLAPGTAAPGTAAPRTTPAPRIAPGTAPETRANPGANRGAAGRRTAAPRTAPGTAPETGANPGANRGAAGRRTAAPGTAGRGTAGRGSHPRRGLVPVLAAAAVVVVLAVAGLLLRPTSPAPAPPAGTGPTVSSSPSPVGGPSQTPREADRDGVPARIAALPLSQRVAPVEAVTEGAKVRIDTPEGLWMISRPDLSDVVDPDTGCVEPAGFRACSDYSEILWMSSDGSGIIKAFPVPDLPAQWLTLTADALYFGRQGDGALPDSMIGRIDRITFALTARVFPSTGPDAGDLRSFRGWPGDWSNAARTDHVGYEGVRVRGDRLQVLDETGQPWTDLDPATLR
jgi:hypothetical protein